MTRIRSRWVAGLLEFFGITTGATVFKITESGVETNITGSQKGAILGSVAISKAVDYSLTAAEKANLFFNITLTAGSKTVTLGLTPGQVAFVNNAGATNAFTLKNVTGDTGTSIAAAKAVMVVASSTKDASAVIELN